MRPALKRPTHSMRGFTTVRDVRGPVSESRPPSTEGDRGPRIYPSGAMITVTSRTQEFPPVRGTPTDDRRYAQPNGAIGGSIVADSPDEVRVHVHERLRRCSQIKLTAGGGVFLAIRSVDVSTFTELELRAAVEAAENWGALTLPCTRHGNGNPAGHCRRCEVLEHGFLMDHPTAKLIAEKGIWLSLQPLPEELRQGFPPGSVRRAKADEVLPA